MYRWLAYPLTHQPWLAQVFSVYTAACLLGSLPYDTCCGHAPPRMISGGLYADAAADTCLLVYMAE